MYEFNNNFLKLFVDLQNTLNISCYDNFIDYSNFKSPELFIFFFQIATQETRNSYNKFKMYPYYVM